MIVTVGIAKRRQCAVAFLQYRRGKPLAGAQKATAPGGVQAILFTCLKEMSPGPCALDARRYGVCPLFFCYMGNGIVHAVRRNKSSKGG
jgi:hypothetical protein